MRSSDLTRLAIAAAVGIVAPYVWAELAGLWALYVYMPLLKIVWSVFSLKGPLVFWLNSILESFVFGALFGLALWTLCSSRLVLAVALFSICFLVTFFGFELMISNLTLDQKLAGVSIAVPSVLLLLAVTAGTCWALSRRKVIAGA